MQRQLLSRLYVREEMLESVCAYRHETNEEKKRQLKTQREQKEVW